MEGRRVGPLSMACTVNAVSEGRKGWSELQDRP